jgi:diguanylate cyclase (GGDEF)-like protein/PAS domain S-box-containing protein
MTGIDASHYRRLFSDLPVAWVVHEDGEVRDFNRAAVELFAIDDPQAALGRRLLDFVHPDSLAAVQERLEVLYVSRQPVRALAERMVRADGRDLWVETIAGPTVLDGRPAVQVLCWDVTDRVHEEARLAHAALHDALTGLPNRAMLEQQWSALQVARRGGGDLPAVLFCDLDDFKRINDEHGHAVGDATLRAVAGRLAGALRSGDVLGRYGGDEFVVLVDGHTPDLAAQLTDRFAAALGEPLHVAGTVVSVRLSMGLAVPTAADETLEDLLVRADAAMYRDKRGLRPDAREQ